MKFCCCGCQGREDGHRRDEMLADEETGRMVVVVETSG